ncbi:hypothetical protein J42TS3_19000 [Paenibacillus vini]|uniref:Uncharacterized protein n=1 Tax=Paenibacillus vini TaxID=1476024 RepID=A0ABQ4MA40_9BACL|nr:hypothetical protein J42TS3_19000 [Paenibacillus vini]
MVMYFFALCSWVSKSTQSQHLASENIFMLPPDLTQIGRSSDICVRYIVLTTEHEHP